VVKPKPTSTSNVKPNSEESVLLTLAAKVWLFRGRLLAAVLLLVVAKIAAVAVPILLKRIVDALSRPEELLALPVWLLAGYALVRFSTTLFSEIRDLIFARVTQSTVADYALRIFSHLHALGARFHANRATGALTRDVERGTSAIGFLLGVALFTIVPTIVEIAIVVGIMVKGYPVGFALVIAATFVLYSFFSVMFTRRRAIRQRRVNELDSNANRRLVDSVLNYDTVKYYTNEAFEAQRFKSIMTDWIEAGIGNQKALTLLHVGQSAIIALGVAAVMLLAGRAVFVGDMTVGDLVLINAYVIQVCLPLNSLGFVFREASDALVKAERLFALLREPPETGPDEQLPALAIEEAAVRFENVGFGYEPSRQVLFDIDFRIAPGSTLAVVGGSGSGKSTLARLLLRFYSPWEGRVTIDGHDIAECSPESVRAAIGIVPQDTSLFNETIAYNIAYGRSGASAEEVVAAAKAANVHDFITALPEQYETVVGERGLKLSGGEKQRIAIARAILKNPPILLLDEATSALDMRSERTIQSALERLARRRTTLIIAHRLATVVNADEILVLEAGRIVERGRHDELLERDGLYAQMWSLQEQERALRRSERRAGLQPVNLGTLIMGAVDGVRGEIDEKGINLYTTLGLDVGLVTGDPGALQEVVWDLIAHAVQVSEPGARVEVSLERAGNEVALRVTDTSVAAATPAAEGSAAPSGKEAGLGARESTQTGRESAPAGRELAPAAKDYAPAGREPATAGRAAPRDDARRIDLRALSHILEDHHGRLTVEQSGLAGTSYTVSLPVRAVAPEPAPAAASGNEGEAKGAAPADVSLSGRRLLVVDDDEDARETLGALLRACGAEIDSFSSGRAAYEYLRSKTRHAAWPDLMVCDIGLPDEDGYTLLRRVRTLEAEHRLPLSERMPAIALTGYSRSEDRVRALVAGFQSHVTKPARPELLLATIRRLLGLEAAKEKRQGAT
jgi:ATP-binding cassette subfamily B protein